MKNILNDISTGNLKNAYLLYGEELYLLHQYKDRLLKAMVPEDDTMNFSRFEGKNIEEKALIEIAETMPFFADFRTILIIDSGFFKTASEIISDYFKEPCETTRFIFVEKEVDKRNRLYKRVKEIGRAVEFTPQTPEVLTGWVLKKLSGENKRITPGAMNLFLEKTGTDMSNISTELEKLICYTYGNTDIRETDVEAIVTKRIGDHIFDMIAAIGSRQQNKALHLYYDLLAAKQPPLKILVLLTRQFNLMLQTKELRKKGENKAGIASKIGLPPFIADKYIQQAAKFTQEELRNALEDSAEAEESVKTGRMADRLAVEILIVKYSCSMK